MRLSLELISLGLVALLIVQCWTVQADDTTLEVPDSTTIETTTTIQTTTTIEISNTSSLSSCVSINCNVGSCIDGKCVCQDPYKGKYCQYNSNPCFYIFCFNGGSCELDPDQEPVCKCKEPYSGTHCYNNCGNVTCENEYKCVDGKCVCQEPFSGKTCQYREDPCKYYKCYNGGTCLRDSDGEPFCQCPPQFNGTLTCQTICGDSYCFNNSTCVDGACVCQAPYSGTMCEIDPCNYKYCSYGVCAIDSLGFAYCKCFKGYTGSSCSINACSYRYCNNGGTCEIDERDEAVCRCKEGYNGTYCEKKTRCDKACENGGICALKEFNYGLEYYYNYEVCNCTFQYYGDNCEIKLEKPRVFRTPDEQCASALGRSFQASTSILRNKLKTDGYVYSEYLCRGLNCIDLKGLSIETSIIPENGTLCGDGKVCLGGRCEDYPDVPKIPINDRRITDTVNCKNYLKENAGFEKNFCSSDLKAACRIACKKYNLIQCEDKDRDCPKFALGCSDGYFGNSTDKISDLCPYTCNTCPEFPIKCPTNEEFCLNGGKCVDIENPKNKKFGFKCKCPVGYSGELCEQYNPNPCTPNPCPDNLQCIKNGQLSYFCTNNTSTVYVRKLIIN